MQKKKMPIRFGLDHVQQHEEIRHKHIIMQAT